MTAPNLYAIGFVPAASVEAATEAVRPYLASPDSVSIFDLPLSANGEAPWTHYGCVCPTRAGAAILALLPGLVAAFPGSEMHTVAIPDYDLDRDWTAWLLARGLVPRATPGL